MLHNEDDIKSKCLWGFCFEYEPKKLTVRALRDEGLIFNNPTELIWFITALTQQLQSWYKPEPPLEGEEISLDC
jgi:hypothetical protein